MPVKGQMQIYDPTSSTGFGWIMPFTSMVEAIDIFSPSNGQTTFSLTKVPQSMVTVKMFINGLDITEFTVNGQTLTYTGTDFALSTTDIIKIIYYYIP